jgi:hypothetical protein
MTLQQKIVRSLRAALAAAALAVVGTGFAVAQTAPTVTISAVPSKPIAPASVVVTWSSTGATSCVASGSWSGVKATSGSQTFINVQRPQSYTLTCNAGSGEAVLTWTPPSLYTDDTPIGPGELKHHVVTHAASAIELGTGPKVTVIMPGTSTTIAGLPAGDRFFTVAAVTQEDVSSDESGIASKTIVLPTATATAVATVYRKPKVPVNIVVAAPQGASTLVQPTQR